MNDLVIGHHRDGLAPALSREIADLHREAIVGGFLSSLGQPFLVALYDGLATSRSAFVITATRGAELMGFICGTTDTRRAYLEFGISRNGPRAAWHLLPKLVSLGVVRRVAETLLYPAKTTAVELPRAEILNFCVSEACRGQGVGKRLFVELVAEFRRRNVHKIRIVTGAGQLSAQAFYDRLSARRVTELEVHDGAASVVYTYPIPKSREQQDA